ncbi:hypothetical protein SAMN06265377_1168 [Flagellimonas pacifica]|uniref:Uncharacterized protein n=1 Tax=Flagellimonas pacifica TaxID=1247520 RepID=A0A285MED2_9FLAO|nr:hypothetical protein SAMN06265377_1168 [Allomuricauda parva]
MKTKISVNPYLKGKNTFYINISFLTTFKPLSNNVPKLSRLNIFYTSTSYKMGIKTKESSKIHEF